MVTVLFYDNDFGLSSWICAQMMSGVIDYHNIPSYERLLPLVQQFRPSDGTIYTCGNHPAHDMVIGYAGCHQYSHIAIKSCRNFLNVYHADQSKFVFIRTPSIPLKWPYKRSDIPFRTRKFILTKQLYKRIVQIFPQLQASVCSVVWPVAPLYRARNVRNHEVIEAGTGNIAMHKQQFELQGRHIVYHCYGSAHSSITSAAIHLQRLPHDRKPKISEIVSLADYDRSETWQIGTLNFKGYDQAGSAIYTIGFGPDPYTVKRMLSSFLQLAGCDTKDLVLQEALLHINRIARIGGALSRRYGYVRLGRTLSAFGIQRQYGRLVQFVNGVYKMYVRDKNKT